MTMKPVPLQLVSGSASPGADEARLDTVFFALADPVRRGILGGLGGEEPLQQVLAGAVRHPGGHAGAHRRAACGRAAPQAWRQAAGATKVNSRQRGPYP